MPSITFFPSTNGNKTHKHDLLMWNKNTKTFVGEISEMPNIFYHQNMKEDVFIFNIETSKTIKFEFAGYDYNGTGEDAEIAGWRYKSVLGASFPCELLIIND